MRTYLALGFISASIIGFQLALIQILSIVQWYHFAYMVLSVALLGFGAAGTVIALFRKRLLKWYAGLVPNLMIISGFGMAMVLPLSQSTPFRFDSYLLFTEYTETGKLAASYMLYFIPFFAGALAIGLIFIEKVEEIGKVYFANLAGSAMGGALSILFSWTYFPSQLPALNALLAIAAGILMIQKGLKISVFLYTVLTSLSVVYYLFFPPELFLSQYKSIETTLNLPDARIERETSSPYGLMQSVTSPAFRYAPGLSLAYKGVIPERTAIFNNGNWFGVIPGPEDFSAEGVLNYTTGALPFHVGTPTKVLVLNSGTGMEVAHAFAHGAEEVTAVEPNAGALQMTEDHLPDFERLTPASSNLITLRRSARTFLMQDRHSYDLITLPMVDAFGGSSGLKALHEEYLLTRESFRNMRDRLGDKGMLSVSCWMDYPVRGPLKILATLVEVVKENGEDPRRHIIAIRSWGTITFLYQRSAFTAEQLQNTRSFCEELLFDPVLLPDIRSGEREEHNVMQDGKFFEYVDALLTQRPSNFYHDYSFNITPATDNRPYFSQFLRWKTIPDLSKIFGKGTLPFLELGYLMLIITLVQIILLSAILIIAPLFRLGWKGRHRSWTFGYFGAIGIGFMLVEIVLIQHFILYFGNAVYATSGVITVLLLFSGIGSYLSSRYELSKKQMRLLFLLIGGLLVLYVFLLKYLLALTITFHSWEKAGLVLIILAPLSVLMGFPFPAGLKRLNDNNDQELIPWGWGINGCASVISTALATLLAVELGFAAVMLIAAVAYCIPAILRFREL